MIQKLCLIVIACTTLVSACAPEEQSIIGMNYTNAVESEGRNNTDGSYTPSFKTKIAAIADRCKVKILGISAGIVDGKEAIYFSPKGDDSDHILCLKHALPQGLFTIIRPAAWKRKLEQNAILQFPLAQNQQIMGAPTSANSLR